MILTLIKPISFMLICGAAVVATFVIMDLRNPRATKADKQKITGCQTTNDRIPDLRDAEKECCETTKECKARDLKEKISNRGQK